MKVWSWVASAAVLVAVGAVAGFGVAADCAARDLDAAMVHVAWRDAAEAKVKAAGATVIGGAVPRLPNTLFMAVEGWDSPAPEFGLRLLRPST